MTAQMLVPSGKPLLTDAGQPSSIADSTDSLRILATHALGSAEAALGQRLKSVTVAASTSAVSRLRRETYRQFRLWGVDEESCYLMQLAFAELGANAIEHGPSFEDVWMQVTWALQRVPGQRPRAVVSVLDAGNGVSRRGDDPDLPGGGDLLPALTSGQRGLRLLLRSGVRIERVVLSGSAGWQGGHLVSGWTPLEIRSRRRVCACPCWEHDNAAAHCEQIIVGRRYRLRSVGGQSVPCCRSCAPALRAAVTCAHALDKVRAAAGETAELVTRLGIQTGELSRAIAETRRLGVAAVDVAASLDGFGGSEELLEIVRTDRGGSKLLWQLAAALAVPDKPGTGDRTSAACSDGLPAVPV